MLNSVRPAVVAIVLRGATLLTPLHALPYAQLHAQQSPPLVEATSDDAVRIREAYRLVSAIEDSVWPGGFANVPFPLMLVTDSREYLIGYPRTPNGFERSLFRISPEQPALERTRQFPTGLLSTFPAFGPPSVIVVGQPRPTGKNSTAWILTILHERFHQYQNADISYYRSVDSLQLSGGDQTGMWMLNYAFPYDSAPITRQFGTLARQLGALVQQSTRNERAAFWTSYRAFLGTLSERDRRYFGFQIWQEGIARYVELHGARVASTHFEPSAEFRALADFEELQALSATLRRAMLRELSNADLARSRRVSFYAFGAALGLMLDLDAPGWQQRYLSEKFAVERYLEPSR